MTSSKRSYYRKKPGFASADLGRELAILDLDSGSYLGFNQTAAQVWMMLEEPLSIEAICDRLRQQFAVGEETCRDQVASLLARMSQRGLVDVTDAQAD
jgi:hypothetical protein